jgi:prepilin-type N-terminal cleavage/methylation domain-containing protein
MICNSVKARGLSLIELLVVISIGTILFALLFPVAVRMQESSKRTQCASNLRQLGAAVHLYAADHDGGIYVPTPMTTVAFVGKGTSTYPVDHPNRFLNPYIGAHKQGQDVPVARSPVDIGMLPGPKSIYSAFGTSYMFNYAPPHHMGLPTLRDSSSAQNHFRLVNVKNPSRTLMIMSHPAFNYALGGDRQQRWYNGPTDDVYINAAFVDGSVRFIRIARPGEPNYPDSKDYTWGVRTP